jgi:cation:H+ antiporter
MYNTPLHTYQGTFMLTALITIFISLVVLVWSADKFVISASSSAKLLGMSPLMIGMTIVSLGTSAPEIFVSIMASLNGTGGLAIGNAIGSNIANVGLVLGTTALISAIPIQKKLMRKEIPLLLLVTIIAGLVLYDFSLTFTDSIVLFLALIISIYLLFLDIKEESCEIPDEIEEPTPNTLKIFGSLLIGLIFLILSSKGLVWGATYIAQSIGISDLVIGLTIVAIGTSLPELAASVSSALKGHHDIAIGNVIGSNIFNLLAVMPIPALFAPVIIEPLAFYRDYAIMFAITVCLILFIILSYKRGKIGRFYGSVLLVSYFSYLILLYIQSIK